MAGDRAALIGLFLYLLVAAAPTALFWIVLRAVPAAWSRLAERRRSPDPGPPLEAVVADLRRLRREICGRAQRTQVRRVALLAAYDDTLVLACRVVGLSDPPLATATGPDRALARLVTEAELEAAGIALDPPQGGSAAA